MELLILCILLSFVTVSISTEETLINKITIEVKGEKYPAYLPPGFKSDIKDMKGYFVAVEPESGCGNEVTIKHKKEDEVNVNKFVTYIDWFEERKCSVSEMMNNLQDANISDFILLVSDQSKANVTAELNSLLPGFNFVLFSQSEDVVNDFKDLVSDPHTGGNVFIEVVVSKDDSDDNNSIPMSSMAILFVTVAFVTLMTVSIGWLVFYYAQRCRQRNMRERLQSRLCVAATRAVGKLPTKTVPDIPKSNKKVTKKTSPSPDNDSVCSSCSSDDGEFCPVCLDLYKPREVIRILPCKHEFHKNCVDPWLFDHRTCPMCKLDILEHFGMLRGERAATPQRPPDNSENNASLRVDQEVQTDFVNNSQNNVILTDEIEPAPLSPVNAPHI